jgi:hypothetical protein
MPTLWHLGLSVLTLTLAIGYTSMTAEPSLANSLSLSPAETMVASISAGRSSGMEGGDFWLLRPVLLF